MNKDLPPRQEADLRLNKNKRDYQVGLQHQSPSPVNYYQNSGGYDIRPPGSPWSNQFYPAKNQFYTPPSSYNPLQQTSNQFYQPGNQFYQPNTQPQEPNFNAFLSKCSERNIYYCKELLAKQLVQHVREMVTYRSGLDPYLFAAIFGSSSTKAPNIREGDIDLLDNEITRDEGKIHVPERPPFYESHTQWYPALFYARPMTQVWPEFPSWKVPETVSGYRPHLKPHFKVPQSSDYFKPTGIHAYDPPLSLSHSQDGFRESKQFSFNSEQKSKICNPCVPSPQNQIDIRKKPEDLSTDSTNSTIPTSRA